MNRVKEKFDLLWYCYGSLCVLAEALVVTIILAICRVIGWGWPVGMFLALVVALGLVVKHGRVSTQTATEPH